MRVALSNSESVNQKKLTGAALLAALLFVVALVAFGGRGGSPEEATADAPPAADGAASTDRTPASDSAPKATAPAESADGGAATGAHQLGGGGGGGATPAPEASVWTFEGSSSGDGNRESVTATFTVGEDGGRCEATTTWESAEGETESSTASGAVEPAGFVPIGPTGARAGQEAFVGGWEPRGGCVGLEDAHYAEVVGRETRTFRINGEDVSVEVWAGVVPESEEWPLGTGEFYWDTATGLLLEAEYEGLSGRSSTRLVETPEALAYR